MSECNCFVDGPPWDGEVCIECRGRIDDERLRTNL